MLASPRFSNAIVIALLFVAPATLVRAESYLTSATTPDPIALLPTPPEFGSIEAQADAFSAHHAYEVRTPQDVAAAIADAHLTVFHFSNVVGPWFEAGKFPLTEALFKEIEKESHAATDLAKEHWHRLRPYHAFPERFPDSVEHRPKNDYSYPSGHSTRGQLFAAVLAELLPEQRAAILEEGKRIGWLRVEGGVHFPEDVFAGRVLGQALAQALLKTPSFQRDLAKAKAELAAAAR